MNKNLLVDDFVLEEPVILENAAKENNEKVEKKSASKGEKQVVNDEASINSIFKMANNNVKEATSVFQKNMELKAKLEERYKEFKKEKEDFELKKIADRKKLDAYKEEVLDKLKAKKQEIEAEINNLKLEQKKLEKDKASFEEQKREENSKIKKEKNAAFEEIHEKRSELEALEVSLRLERENIEEEKRQLELDRIKYESDTSELAANLLKFNELVGEFTVGMDRFSDIKEENQ